MNSETSQANKRKFVSFLLHLEGAIVLGLAAWLIVLAFTHEEKEILPLLGVLLFAIAGGIGLIACGQSFANAKNFGRAPAVLANLIALGVAYYQFDGHFYIGAIPIVLLAIPTLYLALTITPE